MTRERRDIAGAVAQWRSEDDGSRQSIGKPAVEMIWQRLAGGCDQPHVDAVGAVAADRADLARCEDAVERGLGRDRQVADLVEQERATVGLDNLADPFGEGARKGAGHMPEQLAVDDVCRRCAAIECDEGGAAARAGFVNGAGDSFLARTRFAHDQQRQAASRRLGGNGERSAEVGGAADQFLEREAWAPVSRTVAPVRRKPGGGRR